MFWKTKGPSSPATITTYEFAAVIYLALPVAVFFLAYGKPTVGIASAAFIATALWRCATLVDRRSAFAVGMLDVYFVACSAAVVFLSGSFGGGFFPNSDWLKHFAIFRFLSDNSTLIGSAPGYDGATLRYYIGWYIVPAMLTKVAGYEALLPIVSLWTTVGIYLFFRIVAQLSDAPKWRYALPLIFVAFSGADAIGTWLTGYHFGPAGHIEWWAGWVQYSSMVTDIFWAPQHALSAWLGIALAIRLKDSPASLAVFPVVTTALLLWSPFTAIGVAPFYLWAMVKSLRSLRLIDGFIAVLMLMVTIVIGKYLMAGGSAGDMVFRAVWERHCGPQSLCFTGPHYLQFVALETLGFLALLHIAKRFHEPNLWIATAILLTMPLFTFGGANDLNLHATIPALALLAIGSWHTMTNSSWLMKVAILVLLIAGVATPLGEIRRSFSMADGPRPSITMSTFVKGVPSLRQQYLIERAPWMVRKPK